MIKFQIFSFLVYLYYRNNSAKITTTKNIDHTCYFHIHKIYNEKLDISAAQINILGLSIMIGRISK